MARVKVVATYHVICDTSGYVAFYAKGFHDKGCHPYKMWLSLSEIT